MKRAHPALGADCASVGTRKKRPYSTNPQNPQNPPQRGFEGFEGSPTIPPAELSGAPYASALVALCAKCPAYVPEDRWHQAITDATTFATKWGVEAQALGWTVPELFGMHPVPERPPPNYSRLARLDAMGLLWLLRGRPVIVLTSTEAIIRCRSNASLTYRRRAELVPAEIVTAAPATDIGNVIAKPTLQIVDDAAEIAERTA
jgi:hypothetical protein